MNRTRWCGVGVVALVFLAGLGALAEPCTITVQPGESIQEAIDAASPGDVICLAEGEWEEHLVIEKSLTVRGSEDGTTIRGHEDDFPAMPVILVHTPGEDVVRVSLETMTLIGGRGFGGEGLMLVGSAEAIVTGVTIAGSTGIGVMVVDSAKLTITDSTVKGNRGGGIHVSGSAQAAVRNSTIEENLTGIFLHDSVQATVERSTIVGNTLWGILIRDSAQATVIQNTISNNLPDVEIIPGDTVYIAGFGNSWQLFFPRVPDELAFLFTEEGGELDRREEE